MMGIDQGPALQEIARLIDAMLTMTYGQQMGFVLLTFRFDEGGTADYIGNANRGDIIQALRESADRLEAREDTPPYVGGAH